MRTAGDTGGLLGRSMPSSLPHSGHREPLVASGAQPPAEAARSSSRSRTSLSRSPPSGWGAQPGQGWAQGESACKPASVPGSPRGGGHPSGTGVAAGLVRSTRGLGRASLRGRVAAAGASPIRPCSGWGLPSRPVTRPLVRSYRTVSPLPVRSRGPAVCSLWHFPAGRPDWPLASTLPCGGRTFLDPGEPGPRPPSRLPLPGQYATRSGPGGGILGAWSRSWSLRSSSSRWPSWRC